MYLPHYKHVAWAWREMLENHLDGSPPQLWSLSVQH